MDRYFASDLHLGHAKAAQARGYTSIREHDDAVIASLQRLPRRSKLWVLGDIAFNAKGLERIAELPSKVKVAVLGNHDVFGIDAYRAVFDDVGGAFQYKKFFLTHIPIHPQELYRVRGNIHGHIHLNAATPPLPLPYFNANWDFHQGAVSFDQIEQEYV